MPFPCVPSEARLTRSIVSVWRSYTKTSAYAIGIAGDEVAGGRVKRHVAAVGADRGVTRTAVSLRAVGSEAHPLDRVRLAIIDEDVAHAIGIAGDEVAGGGRKRHVAAVGAERVRVDESPFACVPSAARLTRSIAGAVPTGDVCCQPGCWTSATVVGAGGQAVETVAAVGKPWSWRFRRCRVGRCRRHRGRSSSRSGPTRRRSLSPIRVEVVERLAGNRRQQLAFFQVFEL